jgi:nitroreductase
MIPCVEGRTGHAPVVVQASRWGSIIPAAWSFMLAALARGLGTVWTTFHLRHEREAAELLGDPVRSGDASGADPGRPHRWYRLPAGRPIAPRHDGPLGSVGRPARRSRSTCPTL